MICTPPVVTLPTNGCCLVCRSKRKKKGLVDLPRDPARPKWNIIHYRLKREREREKEAKNARY